MRREQVHRLVRVVLGASFFTFVMYFSLFAASGATWTVDGQAGLEQLRRSLGTLSVSVVMGLIALAGTRLIMGWRVLSPWLLLALPIPAAYAVAALGYW
ncbi:hypothetical protein [Haloechinothrix halophila]|uniref:hypothetical protein n=1 Tax=Haloechinothrix halophila TaxID=1069073 RepID=UPI0005558914|nr:hypothetical protein [Haloechinothrix halophila]